MSAAEAVANLEWIATRGQIGAIERIVAQVSGYIVVQDGLIVLANDTAEKLLGRDNLPGTPLNAVLPQNVRKEHAGWMKDWKMQGLPFASWERIADILSISLSPSRRQPGMTNPLNSL